MYHLVESISGTRDIVSLPSPFIVCSYMFSHYMVKRFKSVYKFSASFLEFVSTPLSKNEGKIDLVGNSEKEKKNGY